MTRQEFSIMPHLTKLRCLLCLALFILVANAVHTPAHAANIAVTVNDSAITSRDISQRVRLLKLSSGGRGVSRSKAVDELIAEKLKLQAAKEMNISVSNADVQEAYNTIAGRTKMSPQRFTQAINRMGVDSQTLKSRLKADLAWRDVIQRKFARAVAVRDEDVIKAVREKSKEREENLPKQITEYRVARVVALIPKKSGSATRARNTANTLRGKLSGCANMQEQIKGYKDTVALIPISVKETDLDKKDAAAYAKTKIGQAAPVKKTDRGYEVPIICEKNQVAREEIGGHGLEEDLVRGEISNFAERYLEELKAKAIIVRK